MDLQRLVALLTKHEGKRKFPYLDTEGKITIGIGHNLDAKGLTDKQIMSILMDDIKDTLDFLSIKFPWFAELDEIRQLAIADMTFDLMGGLGDFVHMIDAIEAQDWDLAAKELLRSKFARQAPNRANDLAKMIRTGQDFTNG